MRCPAVRPQERTVPGEVALISDSGGLLDELASQIAAAGISVAPKPSGQTGLVIVAADPGHRVLDAALAVGHPADVVGIHFTGTGDGKPGITELVLPDVTAPGTAAKARALAAKLGLNAVISRDRPGFLTEALAYTQYNDAVRMFQDGYASPADIDTAMMLGCGYPRGPLQMLDDAGPAHVVTVLEAMHAATGDPAFTPVPLLAEYATAGTRFRS
jgi:3-hydroxybutyryl-CoA dehydrogenase